MGKFSLALGIALLAGATTPPSHAADYVPATFTPPPPQREFRAAWIATVGNIDWPSRKNLSTAEQKAELVSILDRPACDALYASQLEPWSEYLTGAMGKPPEPFYDPLALAIEEAHQRGLELHAWFNPYRARHPNARSPISANHISQTRPQLVRQYGSYLWLDPGEREVQEHSLNVVLDVVKRYDVDGVHFDDYFYPYKESANGRELDFPDEASWKKSGAGGKLGRNDWRRENVNAFIERAYKSVKAAKPWVKFGVSPFGIWRPGHPAQIAGFDAYDQLYADARHWLFNGWVDYFAPQLYWAIAPKEQSFPVLLDWWNEQNPKRRHIWPGMNTTKVNESADRPARPNASQARPNWPPEEIVAQIRLAAKQPVSGGHVHWNAKSLLRSSELQAALARGPYAEPALVPASPWLDATAPAKPRLSTATGATSVKLSWENGGSEPISSWVLQFKRGSKWSTRILPASHRTQILDGDPPDAIAVSAIDRAGNASPPASVALRK
jgi:uncharacterized lipoprotein YddW (UPF0748 family)